MTRNALKYIEDSMTTLNINYAYMEMSDVQYPYFVGEYIATDPNSEDGREEATFAINGWTRGTWDELEGIKNAIQEYFTEEGRLMMYETGAVCVAFSDANPIRTDDAELKRIQINLIVKEWKVN